MTPLHDVCTEARLKNAFHNTGYNSMSIRDSSPRTRTFSFYFFFSNFFFLGKKGKFLQNWWRFCLKFEQFREIYILHANDGQNSSCLQFLRKFLKLLEIFYLQQNNRGSSVHFEKPKISPSF